MFFVLLLASLAFSPDALDHPGAREPSSPIVAPKTRAQVCQEIERAYRAGEMTAHGEIDTTPR